MLLPWKIESKKRIIEADGIKIELLDYGSLLIGEMDFLRALSTDKSLSDQQFAKQFVAYCLRFRYEIAEEITDEEILEGMPVVLLTKVFNFLVYGDENKKLAEVKPATKKPKALIQEDSTGDCSSTIQDTSTLASTSSDAPLTLPAQQSERMKKIA